MISHFLVSYVGACHKLNVVCVLQRVPARSSQVYLALNMVLWLLFNTTEPQPPYGFFLREIPLFILPILPHYTAAFPLPLPPPHYKETPPLFHA
jgi:hypothetical protein